MRRIKNPNLAQLLAQLRFTPQKKRQKQLDSAEKLLGIIDKDKEYPFEFVCFKITGFHPAPPRGGVHPQIPSEQPLIKGADLAEDLQIFISKLSGQVARPVVLQKQKVYTIDQLAANLGVSTKTVHRWRKRGLIARKFIFADGKKRFGFPQSAVNKFLDANPDLTTKAKTFARLTKKQKQWVIKQARTLAAKTTMSHYQIIDRVAAQIGKVHETVRYTILNFDKAHPNRPVFGGQPGAISPHQAGELYKLFKQGSTIKELMKRFNRSKSSIYRIINWQRTKVLLARKIEFVPSDEFLQGNAKERILAKQILDTRYSILDSRPATSIQHPASSIQQYLQTLKDTPVLNREQEINLFRRYNYLKYLACINRAGIHPNRVSSACLKEIEGYLAEAEVIKRLIIEANLRLVVSIAGKHTTSGANLMDLVSEGNVSLMRALEKFDYTRGFRFATYASWAIAKGFAHKVPTQAIRPDRERAAALANVQRQFRTKQTPDFAAIERARQNLAQVIKDELNEREQYIILNHFGLLGSLVKKNTKTLKQIGDDLGLSKERVRQIELIALQKLRQSLPPRQFDLLTG